jgi:hypothetical protein
MISQRRRELKGTLKNPFRGIFHVENSKMRF